MDSIAIIGIRLGEKVRDKLYSISEFIVIDIGELEKVNVSINFIREHLYIVCDTYPRHELLYYLDTKNEVYTDGKNIYCCDNIDDLYVNENKHKYCEIDLVSVGIVLIDDKVLVNKDDCIAYTSEFRDKLLNSIVIFGTNEFGDTTNIGYDNLSFNDAFVYSPFKNKIKRYKVCKNGEYFVNLDTNKIVYGDKFKDKYFINFINRNPLKCKVFQDYYIRTNACDSSISDDYMKFGDKCIITLGGKCSNNSSNNILSIPLDCKVVENLNIGVFSKYKESLLNIVIPPQIEEIRLENLKYNDILYISNKTNPSVIKNFVEFTMGDVDLSEYTAKLNSNNLKEILSILDDKVCWVVY